jgi:hypothetical protein
MNKKITSSVLAALMVAGSTSFTAFAAMPAGTVVIGTQAFDLAYANDVDNAEEIGNAIVAGGSVYVKDFSGDWIDNLTGEAVAASVIPAVTYTDAAGSTNYGAEDSDEGASSVAVSAISAKVIKVAFDGAVADTSKVDFTVKQGSSVAISTITTTWNAAKTEAILTNSTNFTAGTYTVNVKNDLTDMGSSDIIFTQQKVAKINITSTKLGINNTKKTGVEYNNAYGTYQVLDQYGVDITKSSLANSLTFQSGVGSVDGKNGVITVTPNMNILQFTTVVITAYDTSSGVNASATLTVSSQVGTLSDISISALTNEDDKVLTAEDTSALFYVTYVATDISGNLTTDYDIVKNGLILNDNDELTSASSYITTRVVHDPNDSKKAAIEVQVKDATDSISMDMPIVITAMTYTGKSSSLNVTLNRAAIVDTIQLQVPSYNIATGEDKEIPFVAIDQNGKVLTKYSDIDVDTVSISGAFWCRNADGTAMLRFGSENGDTGRGDGYSTDGQRVVTATVSSSKGNYSSITINVQKKVMADTLSLDSSAYTTIMQEKQSTGATSTQLVDFGWDNGGLAVKDQYDREIDMTTDDGNDTTNQYYVEASSSSSSVVVSYKDSDENIISDTNIGLGDKYIGLTAGTAGTATVTFKLFNRDPMKADGTARTAADIASAVDTQSKTFSVLANKDIKDYVMDAVPNAIYAGVDHLNKVVTDRQTDYKANPSVYGTTSSGAKVILAGNPIIGASLETNKEDFMIVRGPATTGTGSCAYDKMRVVAVDFEDSAKTGSTTKLQLTIQGVDGKIYTTTTEIKSSDADPVASSIYASVSTEVEGITKENDIITLTQSAGNTYADMLGNSLSEYDASGKEATTQNVYIGANDQYGQDSMKLSTFVVVPTTDLNPNSTSLSPGSTFNVSSDGTISGTAQPGDYVTVSGISGSYVKTIKIVFAGVSVGAEDVEEAKITAATALVVTAEDTKTDASKAAAITAVNALATGTVKTDLLAKVTAIVTVEDTEAAEAAAAVEAAKVTAATALVVTAEDTKTEADKAAAQTAVTALADATAKTELQARVDLVVVPLGEKELKGSFTSMLGLDYVDIAITAGKTPTSVLVDGVEAPASNWSVDGTSLIITNVKATNVITVTIDTVVYTVK